MVAIPWRTGVNMREFAYYDPAFMPHINTDLMDFQLDQLQPIGVKLIRFYACHNTLSPAQTIPRITAALDRIEQHGMQAIICLNDSLSSPFTIPGEGQFHKEVLGHLTKSYWHNKDYQETYLPHIRPIVEACKNRPAVLMWELGNEFAIHPQPATVEDSDAFIAFAEEASQMIKTIHPNALVATGLVCSSHICPPGEQEKYASLLYGMKTIDAITIHFYEQDGDKTALKVDVKAAKKLGKPFYIGELGALHIIRDTSGHIIARKDRTNFFENEISSWKTDGTFSVLPWAFDASDHDVGISDDNAFARIHTDFDNLRAVMNNFASDAEPFSLTVEADGIVSAADEGDSTSSETQPSDGEKVILLPTQDLRIREQPIIQDDNILGFAVEDTPLEVVNPEAELGNLGQEGKWIQVRLEGFCAAWLLQQNPDATLTPTEDLRIRKEPILQDDNILGRANVNSSLVAINPEAELGNLGQEGKWIQVRLEGFCAAWLLKASSPIEPTPTPVPTEELTGIERAHDFDHEAKFVTLPVKNPDAITSFSGFGPNNFSYLTYRDALVNLGIPDGGVYKNLGGLHNGLDIGMPEGTILTSVDWGVVVHVSSHAEDNPFGASPFSVIIRYGRYLALYGHMLSVAGMQVTEGQIVAPGTEIGLSGIGNNFAHLHFELRDISSAHIEKLRQDAIAAGAQDISAHMSDAFNLNSWPQFVPNYVNPAPFFEPALPVDQWPMAALLPDLDLDKNGYPDQVIRAGENAPVAYHLNWLPSYPRAIQTHFWQNSHEV